MAGLTSELSFLFEREKVHEEFQKQVCELLTIKFKVKWGKPEECFGPGQDILFSSIMRLEEKKEYQIVPDR